MVKKFFSFYLNFLPEWFQKWELIPLIKLRSNGNLDIEWEEIINELLYAIVMIIISLHICSVIGSWNRVSLDPNLFLLTFFQTVYTKIYYHFLLHLMKGLVDDYNTKI
jgi:hypothetical protein